MASSCSPCGSVDRNPHMAEIKETRDVAPRAGAWIETPSRTLADSRASSLPVRERGSKHADAQCWRQRRGRSPCGSVDRNVDISSQQALPITSLPVRERGSKHGLSARWRRTRASLPVRERGSKHQHEQPHLGAAGSCSPCGSVDRNTPYWSKNCPPCVAPRAGAWIETRTIQAADSSIQVAPRAGAWIET